MAWGLEARVPFLDKTFLDVAMNIDAAEKMFSKGPNQGVDEDGRPRMEKVSMIPDPSCANFKCLSTYSTFFAKHSIARQGERYAESTTISLACLSKLFQSPTYRTLSSGDRKNNSRMAWATLGLTGTYGSFPQRCVNPKCFTTGSRSMPKELSRMKLLPKGKHVGPKEHRTPKKHIIFGRFSMVCRPGHTYLAVTHVFLFPRHVPIRSGG